MAITNNFIRYYPLANLYIIDTTEDDPDSHVLAEAAITGISVNSSGKVTWMFTVAGSKTPVNGDELIIYSSVKDYLNQTRFEQPYMYLHRLLIEELKVDNKALDINFKDGVIYPHGFFNNTKNGEQVSFPEDWTFKREVQIDDGVIFLTPWEHNASWHSTQIFDTMEEVYKEQVLELRKLNGQIVEYKN